MARWRRTLGVAGLALRQLWRRATRIAPGQTAFTLAGIALPVALLVVVTSVSLGLAGGATVASPDVDYWIVPESDASSAVVEVGGPQFGRVHPVADRLTARSDVVYATPVQVSLLQAAAGNDSEFVIAVGVIPGPEPFSVSGVSTAGLTSGDPHFGDGNYTGPATGEAVLSAGASTLVSQGAGGTVTLETGTGANRSFSVVAVDEGSGATGSLPVVVVHLAELQTLSGTADGDRADQFLVQTTAPGVESALERVYPNSEVVARGSVQSTGIVDSDLALAMAASALVVALVVGLLFSATTIGLSVADRAPERALLAAIGVSARSRTLLVTVEALALALVGGALGVALGLGLLPVVDVAARRFVADVDVTAYHPLLVAYGVAVAAFIGVLVVPYVRSLARRTVRLEVLSD